MPVLSKKVEPGQMRQLHYGILRLQFPSVLGKAYRNHWHLPEGTDGEE